MTFANGLKKLRNERNISQEDLSNLLNISQKTVSSWETGRTVPNMGYIEQICKSLSCTTEDLLGIKERNVGDITFEDIIVKLNSLDIQSLIALKEILDRKVEYTLKIEDLEMQKKKREDEFKALQEEIEKLKRDNQ